MKKRIMYSTKLSEEQRTKLKELSEETKIPQTKLVEDALSLLFGKHDEIRRKLGDYRHG